jgi:hypothetical protein
MQYHAPSKQFTIPAADLERAAYLLRHALRKIRQAAGLPLDRYVSKGHVSHADSAQLDIIDAARKLGIEMGAEWGCELDLRDESDLADANADAATTGE